MRRALKPILLAGVATFLLLNAACTSRHVALRVIKAGAPAVKADDPSKRDVPKQGGFGASDAMGAKALVSATKQGTATEPVSTVTSKTPDGGMSATVSASRTAADGAPAPEGGDVPGAGTDKGASNKPVVGAMGDKAADQSGDGRTVDADGKGDVQNSKMKQPRARPIDGSDPAIIGPPRGKARKT